MNNTADAAGDIRPLLDEFTARYGIDVKVEVLDWETAWSDLVRFLLYKDRNGPSVSEVGATWVSSLIGMAALRPFTSHEVSVMGGHMAFLDAAWQTASLLGENQTFGIPWHTETRLVYYRRDVLEDAGIDEATAFQSHKSLVSTLDQLLKQGVEIPLVLPTGESLRGLHLLASWIWEAGGSFLSKNGKYTLFGKEEAIQGMMDYFGLGQYLTLDFQDYTDFELDQIFWDQSAAVIFSGPWLQNFLEQWGTEEQVANIGVQLLPGIPFAAGSNLVIWKHSRYHQESVQLVSFLVEKRSQIAYSKKTGFLPVRLDALEALTSAHTPVFDAMAKGARVGRSFPSITLWGQVEDRLKIALARVWKDILEKPNTDLEAIIKSHMAPLTRQLDITLGH